MFAEGLRYNHLIKLRDSLSMPRLFSKRVTLPPNTQITKQTSAFITCFFTIFKTIIQLSSFNLFIQRGFTSVKVSSNFWEKSYSIIIYYSFYVSVLNLLIFYFSNFISKFSSETYLYIFSNVLLAQFLYQSYVSLVELPGNYSSFSIGQV